MIKLFRYLKPYTWAVVLAPLFMLLEVVMDLMQPRFLERIIDVGLKNGDMAYIFKNRSFDDFGSVNWDGWWWRMCCFFEHCKPEFCL